MDVKISSARLLPPTSAAALAAAIRRGDAAAERQLVEWYGGALMFILRRECGDPAVAEDLYQECFRIALERLRSSELQEPEKLAAFLLGIARRLLMAYQRRAVRTQREMRLERETESPLPSPYRSLWQTQRAELVRHLIDSLPVGRDRDLLRRRYLMDEDKSVSCAALNLSSQQYNRALHRARQRLRKEIKDASALCD